MQHDFMKKRIYLTLPFHDSLFMTFVPQAFGDALFASLIARRGIENL